MSTVCDFCLPTRRRQIRQNYKLLKILLVVLMIVIASLHLIILPSASGGYNDECFLPDEKRQILRNMVQNISRAFDKFGVEYWLDYGESYSRGGGGGGWGLYAEVGSTQAIFEAM